MASYEIEDLIQPATTAEFKASIYKTLEIAGVSTTSWKAGAVVRTIIAAAALTFSALSQLQAQIARSGFLDWAEGVWLDLLGSLVYGTPRFTATFASGEVTLTNTGGGVFNDLQPGDVVVSNSATGKQYRNTEVISIGSGATLTGVLVQAVERGSESTSPPGFIDTLVTNLTGVTVSNPLAVVGQDAEDDPAYRVRCKENIGALSPNGPADAYSAFAKKAELPDGTNAGVNRVRTYKDGRGTVTVYVADSSGTLTGDANDEQTPLGAVAKSIWENVEPLAVTADVKAAIARPISVSLDVFLPTSSGLTEEAAELAINNALVEHFDSLPIGGTVITPATTPVVHFDLIQAVARRAVPEIQTADVFTPVADIAMNEGEAPTLSGLSLTVHFT
jgi:uncharacterized phage protein gp47/JayE